ncbi:hypothetical protein [Embleya sp. MST-111070]|uniref:hypothetical protein n=1 Tax=Embleya sp. MST-111070 TaxID=3398231 RepID=UPI003F7367C6
MAELFGNTRPRNEVPTWGRVVLVLIPIVSIGFAMWLPFFYLAKTRHRPRDWYFTVVFALAVVFYVIAASTTEDSPIATILATAVIFFILFASVYAWLETRPKRA